MKFLKKLRCCDRHNYPEVRNYDVVLSHIYDLLHNMGGGGVSRRGRCGGGRVGGKKIGGGVGGGE
jgi:hypothetical protein